MSTAMMDRGVGGTGKPPAPSVNLIIGVVADEFGLTVADITSMYRQPRFVLARHVAMWLARRTTGLSYPQIGARFGDRDHTSIMHGCSRIDALMVGDADLSGRVIGLMSAIRQGMAAQMPPPPPAKFVPQRPSLDTIVRMAAGMFQVSEADILSDRQDEATLLARQTGMWLARRLTLSSLPAIGRRFQRRPRTVAHAIARVELRMEQGEYGKLVLGLMDCLTLPQVAA
jgi:chromosomal replication initiation ATPase DnaA